MSDRQRAVIVLIIVNAMWGATFPIMRALNLQVDDHFPLAEGSAWLRTASAAWMISIRFGLALVMFVILFRNTMKRVGKPHLLAGIALGSFFYCGLLLQVIGLGSISASRSGFLTSLAVVFTPLFSTVIRKRLPRRTVMAGVALALVGVTVLTEMVRVHPGGVSLASDVMERWSWGDSVTIVGALFFSAQIILIDYFGKRYESIAFTPGMFATVTILGAITFAGLNVRGPETAIQASWVDLIVQPQFFGLIGILGMFPSLLAFAWMNKYQPFLSATQAAVIYTTEPFFASTWAMFLPAVIAGSCGIAYANETFSWPLLIGGGLILAANVLALWPEPRRDGIG
ncbi:EamA-like transporter family protein [Rubripirellula tenax]|uniref:EamA-like transporter family protein n=1 Tax=Rubripirellula tenax TaxID=2528015 RepID=A0A5C6FI97_9BACT|nr:DMT family transporter [Rubripirellula tenax]TWU59759.1 EamA-like transporter family protein [Rubripirellula tenax]